MTGARRSDARHCASASVFLDAPTMRPALLLLLSAAALPPAHPISLEVQVNGGTAELAAAAGASAEAAAAGFCERHRLSSSAGGVACEVLLGAELVLHGAAAGDDVDSRLRVARHLLERGNATATAVAARLLEGALALPGPGPGHHAVLSALGIARFQQGRPAEAATSLRAAVRGGDASAATATALGTALHATGALVEAGEVLAAAAARARAGEDPAAESAAQHALGLVRAEAGDAGGAAAAHAAAAAAAPAADARAQALRQLGVLALDAGDATAAAGHLRAALALAPDDAGARHRLDAALAAAAHAAVPEPRFVTFATDADRCELKRLAESAVHHGAALDVVGPDAGRPWRNGDKLALLASYLEGVVGKGAHDSAERQLVCVVDGYDVMLAGTPRQLQQRYDASPASPAGGVLFSSDATFYFVEGPARDEAAYAQAYPPAPPGTPCVVLFEAFCFCRSPPSSPAGTGSSTAVPSSARPAPSCDWSDTCCQRACSLFTPACFLLTSPAQVRHRRGRMGRPLRPNPVHSAPRRRRRPWRRQRRP